MKLIHCADIHLGSKMESKLPKDKADKRKGEVRNAFSRMVDYARENDIRHILLAGDIFDSDRPFKKDKEFFYSVVRANPQITFYYLRGNHDTQESYEDFLDNLVVFCDIWHILTEEPVTIAGIELSRENLRSAPSTLSLEPDHINIVMLHGAVSEGERAGCINLAKYRNKHIDYLALGHIHSYEAKPLDDRGVYVYAGCLEGRGYDEMGPKGFVVIDITDGVVTHSFHENSERRILEFPVDISAATDLYSATEIVRAEITARPADMVRICLTGEIDFDNTDLAADIEATLQAHYFHASVKDKTVYRLNADCAEGDISLRAEFIRTVMADERYSDEERTQILSIGLRALAGREL